MTTYAKQSTSDLINLLFWMRRDTHPEIINELIDRDADIRAEAHRYWRKLHNDADVFLHYVNGVAAKLNGKAVQ